MTYNSTPAVQSRLQKFKKDIERHYPFYIGFPAASDFDYQELYSLFGYLLNNIGDPFVDSLYASHSKAFEREVVAFFADLFRAPKDDHWGYVTTGGTEGNLYALYIARSLYPEARLYHSEAAHYGVAKAADILRLPASKIGTDEKGEVDYQALRRAVAANHRQPAIVLANIGTTMTEAKDDVAKIKQILVEAGVPHFIHSDAALAGIYTALLEPHHPFDFADGANSISISGHKFIGAPEPCGVVIMKRSEREAFSRSGQYIGAPDTTITGSRSGHAPLFIWYAIQKWGMQGFMERVQCGLELAEYTLTELTKRGRQAWRNPNALTVMLPTPAEDIVRKWQLATYDGWSHIICMPGLGRERIDAFLADLDNSVAKGQGAMYGRPYPRT